MTTIQKYTSKLFVMVTALSVAVFFAAAPALAQGNGNAQNANNASDQPTLSWADDLSAAECDAQGAPVVNVKRDVINGIDRSSFGEWASLEFNQQIQVWETGEDSYCATVKYEGQFDAFAGVPSPGTGNELSGEESGTFEGGLRFTFDGEFTPGDSQTKGSIGTYNQGCEQTISSCDGPSSIDWVSDYFNGVGYNDFYFGFIYHGGNAGTYVATSDGEEGDILLE